jgi:2,4-dienoyl-CoA reductase-like NADH-dependent reductase (Old Yellow Enzyme family)
MEPVDTSLLFTPFNLRQITLRNRFVVPAMQRWKCLGGVPSREQSAYYRRRVEGGFSLILGEPCAIDHPSASQRESCLRLMPATKGNDAWHRCVGQVTEAGGHMMFQLWHQGALRTEGGTGPYADFPTLSPSGLIQAMKPSGRAASLLELEEIKEGYVRSAIMAQELGAAGVELHGGHGFLLDQFLWPETNHRTDGYGGESMANRVRFPVEVVSAIRDAAGDSFVISFRFSQWKPLDYVAGQIAKSPSELGVMLKALRAAGVDLFNVSERRFFKPEWPGSTLSLGGWTKSLVPDAAVMTVGGVGVNNDVIEGLIQGAETTSNTSGSLTELVRRMGLGEFDLVAVGRASVGDPDWVNKVASGDYEDILPFDRKKLIADMGWESADSEVAWTKQELERRRREAGSA